MRKPASIVAALLVAFLFSAATAEARSLPSAKQAAKAECARLARADGEAFAAAFGGREIGPCVAAERSESGQVIRGSSRSCRSERGNSHSSHKAFRRSYRSGQGGNDAFGRCVTAGVKSHWLDELAAFLAAVRECRDERGHTPESRDAFERRYGYDGELSIYLPEWIAFGRCVLSKLDPHDDPA